MGKTEVNEAKHLNTKKGSIFFTLLPVQISKVNLNMKKAIFIISFFLFYNMSIIIELN